MGPEADISPADILPVSHGPLMMRMRGDGGVLEVVFLPSVPGEDLTCCPFPDGSLLLQQLIVQEGKEPDLRCVSPAVGSHIE